MVEQAAEAVDVPVVESVGERGDAAPAAGAAARAARGVRVVAPFPPASIGGVRIAASKRGGARDCVCAGWDFVGGVGAVGAGFLMLVEVRDVGQPGGSRGGAEAEGGNI